MKKSKKSNIRRRRRQYTPISTRLLFWIALAILVFRIVFGPEMVALLSLRWANTVTIVAGILLALTVVAKVKGTTITNLVTSLIPEREEECDDEEEEEEVDDELTDEELEEVRGGRRVRRKSLEEEEAEMVASKKAKSTAESKPAVKAVKPDIELPDGMILIKRNGVWKVEESKASLPVPEGHVYDEATNSFISYADLLKEVRKARA